MIGVWLRRLLLAIVTAASIYASASNLAATRDLGGLLEDPVAEWEERFEPIRQELPFVRGAVGYISDADVPGVAFDPANEEGEYVLTQYALAPIILVRGTEQEWVVANLSPDAYNRWADLAQNGFEILSSGRGLYLLHRVAD